MSALSDEANVCYWRIAAIHRDTDENPGNGSDCGRRSRLSPVWFLVGQCPGSLVDGIELQLYLAKNWHPNIGEATFDKKNCYRVV